MMVFDELRGASLGTARECCIICICHAPEWQETIILSYEKMQSRIAITF